ANGYPMGAVIGRREVMEAAQSSFISSTYWTDAVGPTAAVAAIRKMERVRLSEHTMRIGAKVHDGWRILARRHGVGMKPHGQYPMSHMAFGHGEKNLALQALMTQEMLDRGYLSTGAFTVSLAHTDEVIDGYLAALDEVLAVLKKALRKDDLESRLKGPLPEQGFGRLT
ncbi:MAG: aminotransferase class III, partial [Candidatus Aminicenantes bacterium]|nr:aminotransferase class III [Candidatus Aminicenantes bacterium]